MTGPRLLNSAFHMRVRSRPPAHHGTAYTWLSLYQCGPRCTRMPTAMLCSVNGLHRCINSGARINMDIIKRKLTGGRMQLQYISYLLCVQSCFWSLFLVETDSNTNLYTVMLQLMTPPVSTSHCLLMPRGLLHCPPRYSSESFMFRRMMTIPKMQKNKSKKRANQTWRFAPNTANKLRHEPQTDGLPLQSR
jgi:hypothetical protein